MLIGKDYKIESDPTEVILYERITPTKGKHIGEDTWLPLYYYSSVQNALKGLVEREVNKTGLKDLETVVKKVKELYKMIEGIKTK